MANDKSKVQKFQNTSKIIRIFQFISISLCPKTNTMTKPIELTLSYFGKSISQKSYSSCLHVGDLYKMFKGIMISEFGQDTWDDLTKDKNLIETEVVEPILEEELELDDDVWFLKD